MRRALLVIAALGVLLTGCGGRAREPLVLNDFEGDADLDRLVWKCRCLFSLTDEWSTSGSRSLLCALMDEQYPGVTFRAYETDWRPYRALAFDVRHVGDDTLSVVVRIDDRESNSEFGSRFNGTFALVPGAQRIEIPLAGLSASDDRPLDLSHVGMFRIFLRNWNRAPDLYLDRVVLEP